MPTFAHDVVGLTLSIDLQYTLTREALQRNVTVRVSIIGVWRCTDSTGFVSAALHGIMA